MSYALNFYSDVCHLGLNKPGRKQMDKSQFQDHVETMMGGDIFALFLILVGELQVSHE